MPTYYSEDSSQVSFVQLSSAPTRSAQAKMQDLPSVKDFGAVGDGVTDDTAAFAAAIAAYSGKVIYVPDPAVNYLLSATVNIPNNTSLIGQGKFSTKIFKVGANDLFWLGDGVFLEKLWLDGQGATQGVGKGVVIGSINANDGHQSIVNCRIINFNDVCVYFSQTTAGSQFFMGNTEYNQYNAAIGSGKYGLQVVFNASPQTLAVPRVLVGCETNGSPSIAFGNCNDFHIHGGYLGDLNFSVNSRGILIAGTRVAGGSPITVNGANHSITGCDIGPTVVLASGVQSVTIGPGTYNNPPVLDGSGSGTNLIYHGAATYTPSFTSSGGGTSIGNGTITGTWNRQGIVVTVNIAMTVGSTTAIGSGDILFGLPPSAPNLNANDQTTGGARFNRVSTGTSYTAMCDVTPSAQQVRLFRDTSGVVNGASPASSGPGDSYEIQFSYTIV